MNGLVAIVLLGIIEGITEFIPVSSTGHLLLAENWLPRQSDLFNVVIQSAAVLAVIPFFWGRIQQTLQNLKDPKARDFLAKIIVAFGITGAGGLMLDKYGFKLPEELTPVAWALLIGGVVFIVVEQGLRRKTLGSEITWTIAISVGFGQLIAAVFPGASRSGTTIMISLLLGLSRPLATEFSFLVGIPTMLAAGGWKVFKALHHGNASGENWAMVGVGSLVAAIVSFIAVKWLLRFVKSHTFEGFGWYRTVLGAGILVWVLLTKH